MAPSQRCTSVWSSAPDSGVTKDTPHTPRHTSIYLELNTGCTLRPGALCPPRCRHWTESYWTRSFLKATQRNWRQSRIRSHISKTFVPGRSHGLQHGCSSAGHGGDKSSNRSSCLPFPQGQPHHQPWANCWCVRQRAAQGRAEADYCKFHSALGPANWHLLIRARCGNWNSVCWVGEAAAKLE